MRLSDKLTLLSIIVFVLTDPQFEFVSWYTWNFPASSEAVNGYIREAQRRLLDYLKDKVEDQDLIIKTVIHEALRPYVALMTGYTAAGWKVVPKEKLMAGVELEMAYQKLARIKAAWLDISHQLTTVGLMWNATSKLTDLYIAQVESDKRIPLEERGDGFYETEECSFVGVWRYIYTHFEGIPLMSIVNCEFLKGAIDGVRLFQDILEEEVKGDRWLENSKFIGFVIKESDFTCEEVNFLRAICKLCVIKLRVVGLVA